MTEGPISIVHVVCSDAFAGVERYLFYTSPALVRRGLNVTVLGGQPSAMRGPLEASGVAYRPAANPASALVGLIRAAHGDLRPDLIHAHMTEAEVVALTAKPLLGVPVVSTLHFARPRGSGPLRRRLWGAIPPRLDRQFAVSDTVARVSGLDCLVIPSGVPQPEVAVGASPGEGGAPERDHVVLVAQRHEPEKRTVDALTVWQASGLGSEGWILELAGTGSETGRLRREARELGVDGSVRFVGFVDDLGHRMARASMLLATTPNEGLGLTVIEAMASRLPVVAPASGGTLESVGAVYQAHLYEPGNLAEGGTLLRGLAERPDERHGYAERLHARYEAEYTLERHAERLEAAYRSVLEHHGRRQLAGGPES